MLTTIMVIAAELGSRSELEHIKLHFLIFATDCEHTTVMLIAAELGSRFEMEIVIRGTGKAGGTEHLKQWSSNKLVHQHR